MPIWLSRLLPIAILLAVITIVVARLPKVDLGHSKAFTTRRFLNWFPLGLTYAFLYMARYNLAAAKNDLGDLITNEDFGTIKAAGTVVYGVSFLINGPLTDRIGGRATMLLAALGAALANFAMGGLLLSGTRDHVVELFMLLYAANMYFQSFGAVSIVKVNAAWFHLRERGTFGGIFGILISLGLYFAFDWCAFIADAAPTEWVFFVPASVLLVFFVIDWFLVRDTPGQAGQADFETGDATWGDDAAQAPGIRGTVAGVVKVGRMMLSQPVILIIAAIEFCSGFLRSALMDWYALFTRQTHVSGDFVADNWGMMQCIAGILGGVVAGVISDRVFGSRRGPVASILYGVMLGGAIVMTFSLETTPLLSGVVVVMMLAIIGVHGMLSGAASMDFGGKKNVGVVVGIIDGLVYLGQGVQYMTLGHALPSEAPANEVPSNWIAWPIWMIPVSLLGLALATRVWNARPKGAAAGH
ncbi:MFS transporter [Sandaracinus amylolyticus]|uniref:Glycerol-3-phosphate transporter n=1 Tax=Sandaracinus amylolyticus TaxID=927083 RepID=A0A0F6YHA3_9BACT|nr:MFS transporter [Sandaracinus amylolyticus]AKF04826.1 Glycerol-3-phosphate transporter [Sandaracinus amylolyticus]